MVALASLGVWGLAQRGTWQIGNAQRLWGRAWLHVGNTCPGSEASSSGPVLVPAKELYGKKIRVSQAPLDPRIKTPPTLTSPRPVGFSQP